MIMDQEIERETLRKRSVQREMCKKNGYQRKSAAPDDYMSDQKSREKEWILMHRSDSNFANANV